MRLLGGAITEPLTPAASIGEQELAGRVRAGRAMQLLDAVLDEREAGAS